MAPALLLSASSPAFLDRKRQIMEQLSIPLEDYSDLSPKGSVDGPIWPLLNEINATDGFVTTSSCSGRVSVFLEGKKAVAVAAPEDDQEARIAQKLAGVGGKGGGGRWLYVSHDEAGGGDDWETEFGLIAKADNEDEDEDGSQEPGARLGDRLVHFKYEPMILHVLAASFAHARLLLRCAVQAGFRESGVMSLPLGPKNPKISLDAGNATFPLVAIRSAGLMFESVVGYQREQEETGETESEETERQEGERGENSSQELTIKRLVSSAYMRMLTRVASERAAENVRRRERFRAAFRGEVMAEPWEDKEARRWRKRAEGIEKAAKEVQMAATDETEETYNSEFF